MMHVFEGKAEVHAFEPQPKLADRIRDLAKMAIPEEHQAKLHVHTKGVADREGEQRMMKNTFVNTAYVERSSEVMGTNESHGYSVSLVTIDNFVLFDLHIGLNTEVEDRFWTVPASGARKFRYPWYVKVDVEGGAVEGGCPGWYAVVNGMRQLLSSRQLEVFSLEYAAGWSPHFFKGEVNTRKYRGPSLRQLQTRLFSVGYATFLFTGNWSSRELFS
jgi:hypothetical protein